MTDFEKELKEALADFKYTADGVKYYKYWKGYKIYKRVYDKSPGIIGMPQFLMANAETGEIRRATPEEILDIL